jgi:hypothetical protein
MSQLTDDTSRVQSARETAEAIHGLEEANSVGIQATPLCCDAAVDTSGLPKPSPTRKDEQEKAGISTPSSPSQPIPRAPTPTKTSLPDLEPPFFSEDPCLLDSTLRMSIYELMQDPAPPLRTRLIGEDRVEFKKFFWVYPKIISIFLHGLDDEDPRSPFPDFESALIHNMTHLYQTRYLTNQMTQSLIQSAQILAPMDPAIALFNMFILNQYDMMQYRFFTIVLEHSLGHATPSITELANSESLTATDTHLALPAAHAQQVYTDFFIFDPQPPSFGSEDDVVDLWELIHRCIRKFDDCRKHLWDVVKSAFFLSDCPDLNHITSSHFMAFVALALPDRSWSDARQLWSEICIRNRATGQDRAWLTFSDITYALTHREQFFFTVMQVRAIPDFAAHCDFNASMLKSLAFIMNRLVYSVPVLEAQAGESTEKVRELATSLRACLFMCDIPGAYFQYRAMLHVVDGELIADGRTVMASNRSSPADVEALLGHFMLREKAIGLVQVEKHAK